MTSSIIIFPHVGGGRAGGWDRRPLINAFSFKGRQTGGSQRHTGQEVPCRCACSSCRVSEIKIAARAVFAVGFGVKTHLMWTPRTVQSGSEQGRVTWEPNHDGRRTEDKPFRTQIGPGTPLPICPTKPGSPGAPIKLSRKKHQWSKAQSRYMMCSCWICSVSSEQQLMCVKDKDRTPYIKPEPLQPRLHRYGVACVAFCSGKGPAVIAIHMKSSADWISRKSSYLLVRSWQTAALWQGLDAHSSMSSSQRGPENPVWQSQLLRTIVNIEGVLKKKKKKENQKTEEIREEKNNRTSTNPSACGHTQKYTN